ncbi:hypothetical protein HMPREF9418_0692 [Neisseria macacae ATCC 33926]|uniref:Uncharacterized protein n=1 Tax=Neisseria macacae ATCC 33926 TaxID=997348 RepID=A0AA36ULB9_9NEIS|nr:hypothetical protein HMPREF9418_0692 [Neisseria macacae ATCC 33926]
MTRPCKGLYAPAFDRSSENQPFPFKHQYLPLSLSACSKSNIKPSSRPRFLLE